jgi:putative SOS response-associated peptidase YedK
MTFTRYGIRVGRLREPRRSGIAMCGRFTIAAEKEKVRDVVPGMKVVEWHGPRYNVAPSQPVPVVRNVDERVLQWRRWGLIPSWAKEPAIGSRMINARAETLAEKPAFRSAFEKRRCVIVADGFYEWQKVPGSTRRKPFHFRIEDGRPFAFAGLWDRWMSPEGEEIVTCTIITTAANERVKPVHERMPVIMRPDRIERWLNPEPVTAAVLQACLEPRPASEMVCHGVSTRVNNPRNDDDACLAPAGEQHELF